MKKIIVFGSNSYIARNFVFYLQKNTNYQLFLYDYQESSFDGLGNYRQINILDRKSLENIDFNADGLYFFIGKTGTMSSFSNYELCLDINEKALLNVLSIMAEQKVKTRIIFPSTRLVYKGQSSALKEDSLKEGKTIYAINKLACEEYLKAYHNLYGLNYTVLRICVPYGTMVSNAASYGTAEFFINKALKGEDLVLFGDGSQRRTFTHISDLCDVMLKALLNEKCSNDVFNVGGTAISLLQLAESLSKKYHVPVVFKDWQLDALRIESGDTVFDSSKLDNIIGHKKYLNIFDWLEKQ